MTQTLPARPLRVLLLGGSTEASTLALLLARDRRFDSLLSLAGRTKSPRPQPIPCRTGGFGGAAGLARFIASERIDVLVDATHPFAAQISRNAIEAAKAAGTPLIAVERPAWNKQSGDQWIEVDSVVAAVDALGRAPKRVFCAIGGLALGELRRAAQHSYVVRLIDAPAERAANTTYIEARGPFTREGDIAILRSHGIEVVLAKNAGGSATVSKIEAARALTIPVIMVQRPPIPRRPSIATAGEAMTWLAEHYHARSEPRGV